MSCVLWDPEIGSGRTIGRREALDSWSPPAAPTLLVMGPAQA